MVSSVFIADSLRVRALRVLALLAAAAALMFAAACGSDDEQEAATGQPAGSSGAAGEGGAAKQGFKVALLTPGTENDGSWGQAVSDGTKEYAAKYGAEVTIADNLDDPAQYQQQGNSFASAGFELIINANGAAAAVTQKLAEQYPDVKFGQIAAELEPLPDNVSTATPIFQNGTFVAGYLAGLMTETDVVGTIGGFDFPVLTSEMEGFALGARYANPDVRVLRTYINSWTDTGKAKAAAAAQQAQKADIIFSATDQATQGIFQVAQQGGSLKYVIPQYFDKSSQAPDVVLTSVLYNLQGTAGRFIDMFAQDKWVAENAALGLDFGVGKLAPYGQLSDQVPDDVKQKVEDIAEQVESGEVEVPALDKLGKSGDADDIDPKTLGGAA